MDTIQVDNCESYIPREAEMIICDNCSRLERGNGGAVRCLKEWYSWIRIRPVVKKCHDFAALRAVEELPKFTSEIPTELGYYWVDPGLASFSEDRNGYEIVKVENVFRFGDRIFWFTHKVDYLDLVEVQNEFLKEDKGLFGPKIEPPIPQNEPGEQTACCRACQYNGFQTEVTLDGPTIRQRCEFPGGEHFQKATTHIKCINFQKATTHIKCINFEAKTE